jgi:hypothetical protein
LAGAAAALAAAGFFVSVFLVAVAILFLLHPG